MSLASVRKRIEALEARAGGGRNVAELARLLEAWAEDWGTGLSAEQAAWVNRALAHLFLGGRSVTELTDEELVARIEALEARGGRSGDFGGREWARRAAEALDAILPPDFPAPPAVQR